MVIVRVLGLSAAVGLGCAGLVLLLFNREYKDCWLVALLLGCVGAVVGAVAGAAYEVVSAWPGKDKL